MTTTSHEDQYLAAPEPVREPLSREAILKRNIADLEVELKQQTERAESYAETLRSIASYVGAGGYNADTVDAGVFEDKIRWGIRAIQGPLIAAIERAEAAEAELARMAQQKPVAWMDAGMTRHAEIIRNARRYLALRKVGVQVPGYDFVKFDWSLDAAADRLLEGGK